MYSQNKKPEMTNISNNFSGDADLVNKSHYENLDKNNNSVIYCRSSIESLNAQRDYCAELLAKIKALGPGDSTVFSFLKALTSELYITLDYKKRRTRSYAKMEMHNSS